MLYFAIAHGPRYLKQLLDRQGGQGLVEYALILSLVSIATIVVLGVLGVDLDGIFETVETALDNNNDPDPAPAAAPAP